MYKHNSNRGRPVQRDDGQSHDGRDAEERRKHAVELTDGVADHPRVAYDGDRRRRTVERRRQQVAAGLSCTIIVLVIVQCPTAPLDPLPFDLLWICRTTCCGIFLRCGLAADLLWICCPYSLLYNKSTTDRARGVWALLRTRCEFAV